LLAVLSGTAISTTTIVVMTEGFYMNKDQYGARYRVIVAEHVNIDISIGLLPASAHGIA